VPPDRTGTGVTATLSVDRQPKATPAVAALTARNRRLFNRNTPCVSHEGLRRNYSDAMQHKKTGVGRDTTHDNSAGSRGGQSSEREITRFSRLPRVAACRAYVCLLRRSVSE